MCPAFAVLTTPRVNPVIPINKLTSTQNSQLEIHGRRYMFTTFVWKLPLEANKQNNYKSPLLLESYSWTFCWKVTLRFSVGKVTHEHSVGKSDGIFTEYLLDGDRTNGLQLNFK